jgi:hypothetical protein
MGLVTSRISDMDPGLPDTRAFASSLQNVLQLLFGFCFVSFSNAVD